MSRIEGEFLYLALEIGLAETIAETLKDVDRAIADLADRPNGGRYRHLLEEQRATLRNPALRNVAALVVSMCVKDPSLTSRIRRAFADLAERHPELAWFYVQLPQDGPVSVRDVGIDGGLERRRA